MVGDSEESPSQPHFWKQVICCFLWTEVERRGTGGMGLQRFWGCTLSFWRQHTFFFPLSCLALALLSNSSINRSGWLWPTLAGTKTFLLWTHMYTQYTDIHKDTCIHMHVKYTHYTQKPFYTQVHFLFVFFMLVLIVYAVGLFIFIHTCLHSYSHVKLTQIHGICRHTCISYLYLIHTLNTH